MAAAARPRRKKHHFLLWLLLLLVCAGVAGVVGLSTYWLRDLPELGNMEKYAFSQTTTVYANDESTVLAEFYLQDRQPVTLAQISSEFINATLAIEDERFYDHGAIDVIGIGRALVNNLTNDDGLQGASTISQQLVRNTVLADEAIDISVKRKLREARLALDLEESYTKDEILNLYLNTINYGDNCYGVQAAAKHYFQKDASELSVLESATLAGIPQSPNAFTPTIDPDACRERRNLVLGRMAECGYLGEEELASLIESPLELNVAPASPDDGIYRYPYFTSYVRDLLLEEYSTSEVFEGGLSVYTTLDVRIQDNAQNACDLQLEGMAEDLEVSLVSIDPDTGFIKAMVGGRDFYADQFNLATQAQRQPGSSFKAFTLTTAIKQGINPSTYVDCSGPAELGTEEYPWKVENFGNASYGIRTIQNAFAISSNTGFARLIQEVGSENVVKTARAMGITSELEAVDSLTLGTYGVTPLEMADAYATFATGGIHRPAAAITKIVDRDDNTIYEWEDEPVQAIDREVACAAIKVMKTVLTEGTATAAQLYTGQEAAGKTGTSENYRDHWLCAYTPQLSTAVWIGSREEREIPGIDCCFVWRTFMTDALSEDAIEPFPTAPDPAYNNPYNAQQQATLGAQLEREREAERERERAAQRERNRSSSSSASSSSSSQSADQDEDSEDYSEDEE